MMYIIILITSSVPNLLGRGGFGEVYKAKHKGKVCYTGDDVMMM